MSIESKKAEEIVRQFALGLNTLDLSKIAFILHKEFKFVYRLSNGYGHGIRTDVRYIGHMYKAFVEMKAEGIHEIKTGFCELDVAGVRFLGIKIFPPHDRRILFPMDYQILEYMRAALPAGEAILLPRVKNGYLCKVECFESLDKLIDFYYGVIKIGIATPGDYGNLPRYAFMP